MEKEERRMSQPARKEVERIGADGKVIDRWNSVREMCDTLKFDRRAVLRVLKGEPKFRTVKKCSFRYING